MKTYVHFWQYLTQSYLEGEMFQTNVVQKIRTHISRSMPTEQEAE
jgi:hypothetical protein